MSHIPAMEITGRRIVDEIQELIQIYRRFDILAKISVWILLSLFAVSILAPVLAPYEPHVQHYEAILAPPLETKFVLGTDIFGRDVLSRLIYGGRVSLSVAFGAVTFAVVCGCTMGAIGAWSGGFVDDAVMRFSDMIFAFPSLVIALALIAVYGPSMTNLVVVIGIVYSPQYARLIRSTILSVKEEQYVEAAITTGISSGMVLFKHVVPNSLAPVIVQASFHLAWAILLEATLSFLGLGVQPPSSSWGLMIANGRSQMPLGWWLMAFPGMLIMAVVLTFNFIGDGLQSEFDPHKQTEEI